MEEWKEYKYKDLFKWNSGKPFIKEGTQYPVYGSNGVIGYSDTFNYSNRIILGRVGAYCGSVNYYPDKFYATDNTLITECDETKIVYPYAFYMLGTSKLNSFAGGAAQPLITQSILKHLKCYLPPLPTQQKIASILSAYDNLIQNYKKQIEALQTAASELYKEWFVRFRFPGWQNAKFENGIPEGWQIARVGDYVKIKSGFAFKSEWWQDEGCPVVKIKDIDNGEIVITDLDFVSEEHTKKAKSFLLNEGDLVIAMTGATIGKIGLTPKIKNLYTNQRVGKFFLPENPFETMPFLYCLFSQNSTVETILCLSGASSAQPNISPDQLESIKFFFNEDIVFQFNKKSAPFFRKILKLREQITNLTQQRDLLLPRLMSGKLEV